MFYFICPAQSYIFEWIKPPNPDSVHLDVPHARREPQVVPFSFKQNTAPLKTLF
jgi:hypothetical protein